MLENTQVVQGWITIADDNSLAPYEPLESINSQYTTTVDNGAGLFLLPLASGAQWEQQTVTVTGVSYTVASASESSTTVTLVLNSTTSGINDGDSIDVLNVGSGGYNGTWTVTSVAISGSHTTVTYTASSSGLSTVLDTGSVTDTSKQFSLYYEGSSTAINVGSSAATVQSALSAISGSTTFTVSLNSTGAASGSYIYTITMEKTTFQPQIIASSVTGTNALATATGVTTNITVAGSNGDLSLGTEFILNGAGPTVPYFLSNLPGYDFDGSTGGALMNLTGINNIYGNVELNTTSSIGVEQTYSSDTNNVNYSANYFSQLTTTGPISQVSAAAGITKIGSQRLILHSAGTYAGPVDIQQGVILVQNHTGLGTPAGTSDTITTTTVEAGAALELSNTLPGFNGGVQDGLQGSRRGSHPEGGRRPRLWRRSVDHSVSGQPVVYPAGECTATAGDSDGHRGRHDGHHHVRYARDGQRCRGPAGCDFGRKHCRLQRHLHHHGSRQRHVELYGHERPGNQLHGGGQRGRGHTDYFRSDVSAVAGSRIARHLFDGF